MRVREKCLMQLGSYKARLSPCPYKEGKNPRKSTRCKNITASCGEWEVQMPSVFSLTMNLFPSYPQQLCPGSLPTEKQLKQSTELLFMCTHL